MVPDEDEGVSGGSPVIAAHGSRMACGLGVGADGVKVDRSHCSSKSIAADGVKSGPEEEAAADCPRLTETTVLANPG